MRTFLASLSLVVLLAYPAVGGINYNFNAGSAFSSPQPYSSFYSTAAPSSYFPTPSPDIFSVGNNGLLSTPNSYLGGDFGYAGGYSGLGYSGVADFPQPVVSKLFTYHTAPEEAPEVRVRHLAIGQPQKSYRVVFIKAPAQTQVTRLSASFAPKEEKTVIYVLSKKDENQLINEIVEPPPTEPSKPEVVFVKYKTPEEAEHAQRTIQAQYDALGGSTQLSDEGVAPLTSVEGSLGQTEHLVDIQPTTENLLHILSTRSPKLAKSVFKRH